jgi:serine protease
MPDSPRSLLAALAIALLVTACGGGGGGGGGDTPVAPTPPPAPPPEPPPIPTTFSISGTITASPSQAVDWDNNDPASTARTNNTPATAQPISIPTTLGGYVNVPEGGAEGLSFADGDVDDFFRVELLAGQSVTMLVADFEQADADLYLFDTQGNIVDFSIELGEIESLVIPSDGTYIVNVFAFDGGTNYILAIGNQNAVTSQSRQHFEIVPFETVVQYREGADLSGSPGTLGMSGRFGLEQRAGGPGRTRLMALRRGAAQGLRDLARNGGAPSKGDSIPDPQLLARWETLQTIKSLRRDPDVEFAEPNYRVHATAIPDDEAYPFQWHYPLIDLPSAWDTTTGDPGVIVAVIDTGVLAGHPDLQGQFVPGYDFIRDSSSARDGDGIDPNPEDPGDGQNGGSSSFHGTHVSGTVAASGDNRIGVTGVAYEARIMPLRALGAGGGTTYDVQQSVRFAAGLSNDSGTVPARRADIINLSLGGGPFSQASQALYQQARAAGVIIVASAGNEGSSLPSYPASYEGVISVAAVDAQRQRTSYSNTGRFIDVTAPGGNNGVDLNGDGFPDGVLSTGGIGNGEFGYTFLSGTSMSAPHVAGVLALMKSVNPDLGPDDIDALLIRGELSDDLGSPGRDDSYGHGLINAQRAVTAALEAGGAAVADNPLLSASASTLNFSGATTALQLELRNGGRGELDLLELGVSEPWLGLLALEVDASGLGVYRVQVNRDGLANGVYAADITASSTVNSLTVRVIMTVGRDGSSADVGVIYILLLDPETSEPVEQFSTVVRDGQYAFAFNDLEPGRYSIVAGSDADNDLLICDAGEACGAWLTLDQPVEIELDADRNDINFPVDYLITIPSVLASSQETITTPPPPTRRLPASRDNNRN